MTVVVNANTTTIQEHKKHSGTRTRRTAQAVSYDILQCIYDLNLKQQEFQDSIKDRSNKHIMQHYSNIGRGSDGRHEKQVKRIKGNLYLYYAMATTRNISIVLHMNQNNVKYYLQLLRHIDMLDYDESTTMYRINAKGIEYTIAWDDVKRLFPYPFNTRKDD